MVWLATRARRIGAVIVSLVIAFGVVGALAIPAAARWALETVASRELGRGVHVEAITANPYTWRITVKGLTVDGQPGEAAPLLTIREASINASVSTLLRFAPVIEQVSVDGFALNVVRLEPQRFNFTDILERLQARPKKDEPARFSLHNIELTGGTINFEDRIVGRRHVVGDLRLGIPFLSNLPIDAEITVQPALAGRIDDAPFDLKGETRPFHESLESSIAIKLDRLDVPKYLAFSPIRLDFDVPSGRLNTDLRVTFRQAVSATKDRPALPPQTLVTGKVEVGDFALAAPAGGAAAPLVGWKSLVVSIEEFDPLQRRLVLADVLVDQPSIVVTRDRRGALNWQRFADHPVHREGATSGPRTGERAAAATSPYAVTLKHGAVRSGHVKAVDDLVGGFTQDVVNLQVEASGLTTARADQGKVTLSAEIKGNGSMSLDGELGLAPLAGRLKYAARDVRLVAAARYLASVLDGTIDGSSDIDGVLELDKTDAGAHVALRDVTIAGRQIRLRGPAAGGAALTSRR
jgi:uncharacterized protein involved in outer membrane biogenesis